MRIGLARFKVDAAVLACTFLFCASGASAQTLTDAVRNLVSPGKFAIQESGYWTCEVSRGDCVHWLDNERVIFSGTNPAEFEKTPDGRKSWKSHGIYVWNLRTGVVTKHSAVTSEPGSLCVVDGYVRYTRPEGEDVITMAGEFGQEIEIGRRKFGVYPKPDPKLHGWNTRLSCGRYLPSTTAPLIGSKVALKDGDGFLYFGPMNQGGRIRYFKEGNHEIELPVERWKVSPSDVLRSEFDNSYILFGPYRESEKSGISTCTSTPIERHIYRFTTDGRLADIAIPPDRRLRCNMYDFNVVQGAVLIKTGGGHATNVDLSVLYLLRSGVVKEVIRGISTEDAVSPNGCLLALGINSSGDSRRPPAPFRGHLKVIDFCAKGKGS